MIFGFIIWMKIQKKQLINIFNLSSLDFEIMFVNNVSDDKTITIIEGITEINGGIKLITPNKNLGVQSQN